MGNTVDSGSWSLILISTIPTKVNSHVWFWLKYVFTISKVAQTEQFGT